MANPWQDLDRPPLAEAALRRALTSGADPAWTALDVVAQTGSTNADLVARARTEDGDGLVLVADHQSAGRGRRDRSWQSPPRAGLAVSVLLRPAGVPVERWAWLNLVAGVAIVDAVRRTCGLPAVLKWPNDVLVPAPPGEAAGELKLAGLLAEVVPGRSGPAIVLGFGLNVSQSAAELPVPTATSLRLAGSAVTDRDPVLRAVLRELSVRYRQWLAAAGDPRAGLAAAYRERCATIGRPVRAQLPDGSSLVGLAEGVDDAGRLLVREAPPGAAVHPLSAGDIVHIRPVEAA